MVHGFSWILKVTSQEFLTTIQKSGFVAFIFVFIFRFIWRKNQESIAQELSFDLPHFMIFSRLKGKNHLVQHNKKYHSQVLLFGIHL